jgi:hypothetical protein
MKKIREREGKNYKNKNSKVEELKVKSQAAMEYLMTYGWAILIIALVLGVLYSLGIMNPKNFLPRAPPGSCFVFRPNGPGTTDFVSLQGTCGYLPMYVGSFDGVNGYIQVADNTMLQQAAKPPFTFCSWIYPRNNTKIIIPGRRPFGKGDGYDLVGGWHVEGRDTSFGMWWNNGSSKDSISFNMLNGRWSFLCIIFSLGNVNIYLNSNLLTRKTTSVSPVGAPGQPFYIGRAYEAKYYNCSITNVQIYNTALTPQEIQYLYQQGLGGGPVRLQNLVGWWPLNGDAKDYSGNNNHGTIYGGVTFVQNYNPP